MKLFPDPLGVSVFWRYGLPLIASLVMSVSPADQVHWVGSLTFALLMFWGAVYMLVELWRTFKHGYRSTSFETLVCLFITIGLGMTAHFLLHPLGHP